MAGQVQQAKKAGRKATSPFKDVKLFEKEIIDFANKHRATVSTHGRRVSEYFEMSCFNDVVRFYAAHGYTVTAENLIGGEYRYKTFPTGIQSNFSHFKASIIEQGQSYEVEIHHNLGIESSHIGGLYTTPDIGVVRSGSVKERTDYYDGKQRFSHVDNIDCYTFCEVKHYRPFP